MGAKVGIISLWSNYCDVGKTGKKKKKKIVQTHEFVKIAICNDCQSEIAHGENKTIVI